MQDAGTDSIVLEEEIDPNYVPSEAEVVEYAKWLGMDLDKDQDLFWIAREGLMAPLPADWKPCKTKDTEDIYYFNFASGESTWDHPCDGYYKRLYEEEKKKKEIVIKESNDQNRTKAKSDIEQILGKAEKKKKKKGGQSNPLGGLTMDVSKSLPGPLVLGHKPLPGISSQPLRSISSNGLGPLSQIGSSGALDAKLISSMDGPRLSIAQPIADTSSSSSVSRTVPPFTEAVAMADTKPVKVLSKVAAKLDQRYLLRDDSSPADNDDDVATGAKSSLDSKEGYRGGGGGGDDARGNRPVKQQQRVVDSNASSSDAKESVPLASSSSAAAAVRVAAPIEQYLHNPFSVSDGFKKSDQDIFSNLSRFSPPKTEPAAAAIKQRESASTRTEGSSSAQMLKTSIPPPPPPPEVIPIQSAAPKAVEAPIASAAPKASDPVPVKKDPLVSVASAAPRIDPVVQSTPTPIAEQAIPSESRIIIAPVGAAKQDIIVPPSAGGTSNKAVGSDLPSSSASSSSSSSSDNSKHVELQNELQYYKSKCANLTEVVKDCETRLDDYKKMYMDSRESLSALERRLETREMEWKEKLRGVELERDKAENDKRQARFALIDLEMKAQPSNADPSNSSSSVSAVQSKVPAAAADLKALMEDIQVSKAALARSAASHMELQTQLQSIEKQHKEQMDGLITEHNHILLESASQHQADISEYKKRLYALEADQSGLNNTVDDLKERIRKEQQEHAVITSNMQSAQDLLLKRNDALFEDTKKLQASYSAVSSELQLAKSQVTLLSIQADGKLDAQRIHDETHQHVLDELRSSESKLRVELAERSKRANEQQDTIDLLRAQLASSAAASTQGSDQQVPLSSFDQAVEHAAVTRRQLEAEIDQLKEKINGLEGEKNTLVTQKSRQETELRHAKAELNANASVVEANRVLEIEKQQLMTQLLTMRNTNNDCLEELDLLKKSYEQLLQISTASRSSDPSEWVSKLEYDRVVIDLQSERAVGEQLQKKIKSYQEELMCLQRRLEDKAIADALKEEDVASSSSSMSSSNKQQLLYEEHISRLALEIDELKRRDGDSSSRIADLLDEATVLRAAIAKQDVALQLKEQELQQHIIKLASFKPSAVSNAPVAYEAGEGTVSQHLYKDLIQKKQVLEGEKVQLLVQINDVQHKLSMMTTSKLDSINTLKQQHHAEVERLKVSLQEQEQEQSRAKVVEQVSTTRLAALQMELSVVYKDAELKTAECFEAKAALAQVQTRCGSLLHDMDAKEELIRQLRAERDELKARMGGVHDSELREMHVTKQRDALDKAVRDLKKEVQELLLRSGGKDREKEKEGRIEEVDRYQLLRGEMDILKASFASNTATATAAVVDHHHNKENILHGVAASSGGNSNNNTNTNNNMMDFDKIRVSDAWGQHLQQQQQEQPIRLRDSHSSLYPPPPMHQSSSVAAFHADSNAKQQIVELSWALSQQQLSMVRMEEYLLHTNKLIRDMKIPTSSSSSTADQRANGDDARPTSAPASLRSSHRHHHSHDPSTTTDGRRRRSDDDDNVFAVDVDSSPDFMSLLRDKRSAFRDDASSDSSSITPSPLVPIHHHHHHHQKKNSRLRKSSVDNAKSSSEHFKLQSTRQPHAVASQVADNAKRSLRDPNFDQQQQQQPPPITVVNVLSNESLDRLIKKYELHRTPSFNNSKRGSNNNSSSSSTGFSIASANLSLMDVKSRTRREARFLVDLRDLCQAAKKAILHDQACIRNLKELWKSKGSSSVVVVSAEMINSMTLKANIAVDALREGQELLKTRERKLRILSKSVEYFEQLLQQLKGFGGTATAAAAATVNTSHVQELLRVIQQHCIDSANDFTVILHSHANQQQACSAGVFRDIIDDIDVNLSKEPDYLSDVAVIPEHRSSSSHVFSIHDAYSNSNSSSSRHQGISDNHHHSSAPQRSTNSTIARNNNNNTMSSFTTRPPSAMSSTTATAISQKDQREAATGIALIRNKETRSRMLQDQIQKIAARQSQSKAECEKHFGWLDSLSKEVSSLPHARYGSTVSSAHHLTATSSAASSLMGRRTSLAGRSSTELISPSSSSSSSSAVAASADTRDCEAAAAAATAIVNTLATY